MLPTQLTIAGIHCTSAQHALNYAREILGRLHKGEILDADDELFALDLAIRHPAAPRLVAGGVESMAAQASPTSPLARAFGLRLRDGSISVLEPALAVRQLPDIADVRVRAMVAIDAQLEQFKQERFRGGRLAPCERTGHLVDRERACVMPAGRTTLVALLATFCARRGFTPQQIGTDPLTPTWRELEDAWTEFHAEHAQLQLVAVKAIPASLT